jgi:tRNA wybutosine-synthesizing protein 2
MSELLALVVPKREAQITIQKAHEGGFLDGSRKVLRQNEFVEVPITAALPQYEQYKKVRQKRPEFYDRAPCLAEVLGDNVTTREKELLPRGWYILGKVVVVKIDSRLESLKEEIGEALLHIYPRCRCVLRDFGIEGQLREPRREVIAGKGTVTVHRENGVQFKLDAMNIMFSPGNLKERMRMSRLGINEVVVDMFAGIGYFSLPMAIHSRPQKLLSIELNPLAYRYLVENVRLNRVEEVVEPLLGDCSEMTPENIADRVVMGYVGITDRYLGEGIRALRSGGVLHYHQTVPERLYPTALEKEVEAAAIREGRYARVLRKGKVKKYSPGMLHAVLDARIE